MCRAKCDFYYYYYYYCMDGHETLKLETETLASPAETRRWPRKLRLDRDVKAGLNLVVIAVVKLFFTFIGC